MNDRSVVWPRPEAAGFGLAAAIGGFLVAQGLAAVWAGSWAVSLADEGETLSPDEVGMATLALLNVGLWVGYLAVPIVYRRMVDWPIWDRFEMGLTPAEAGGAIAAGVGMQLAVLPAVYWVVLRFVPGDPGEAARELVERVDGPTEVGWLLVTVLVMAPLAEEWFFRGMLLPTMAHQVGKVGAMIGTSILFALVHLQPIQFPGLFLLAMVLAWLVQRTGRLSLAILAHFAFNATTVVQLLLVEA